MMANSIKERNVHKYHNEKDSINNYVMKEIMEKYNYTNINIFSNIY